jgi:cell division protease FtsH
MECSLMAKRTKNSKGKAEPGLLRRLRLHFRRDPSKLPIVEQNFEFHERPNLHLAVEELLHGPDRQADLIGIVVPQEYHSVTLSKLSQQSSARHFQQGPVEYLDVALAGDRHLACVKRGLYFFRSQGERVVLLISQEQYTRNRGIIVEVMAADREGAEKFVRQLTRLTRHGKAYRGQVLSLEEDCYGSLTVRFHRLPPIRRNDIILPDLLLQRIERHSMSFSRHADRLRAAGRHLKRGILLHGPPGTGKTLSAMYLATQMEGRTVLLLTGAGLKSIETACQLARMLLPATIILEDVDLIGTEREHQTVGANALLFELLNQMDGLAEDADILFILTSNRPEILEPALAARPGRIDQAIEIVPPDADCRRRLFELYGRGLNIQVSDWPALIERTAGVSGAFIRELLRKAAVFAAEDSANGELVVRDEHVLEGLTELVVAGGPLTQSLLGAARVPVGNSNE